MKPPELLSPAGTLKSLDYALAYGADAVYAGHPRYSLRVRENAFNLQTMAQGIQHVRQHKKKLYIACNITPHNNKLKTFIRDMEPVMDLEPDALIMSDPGLIHLVQKRWPHMPLHLSVQANVVNYATVAFWQSLGLSRIILSRELSLEEIEEIQNHSNSIELEVFIHGALCIAYSGRCLLSGYLNHRDANQGACTNACRWQYKLHETEQTLNGDVLPKSPPSEPSSLFNPSTPSSVHLLEEKERPGEFMPLFEDENGTYILNSKDLRAVQHVARLTKMGIDSLKIEGRTKSFFYVARSTQVYRKAIDAVLKGMDFDQQWMEDLEDLANRGYTEGFYQRHAPQEYQNYLDGSTDNKQQFVGEVIDQTDSQSMMTIQVKNRFDVGDEMELMTPSGNTRFPLTHIESQEGASLQSAPGSGHIVRIPIPKEGLLNHGLLIKRIAKPR